MSKSYTPGLKVIEKTSIKKERILPLPGEVHVEMDQEVSSNEIVASTKIPGNIQMLNIANHLNIDPEQVPDAMLCKVDEKIKKDQVIARSKGLFGLFKSEIKSPFDGTLGNISAVTGQVIISEPPHPIEVDAYIPGVISKVIDKEGVTISSTGALIQGIIGIGGEQKGILSIINKNTNVVEEDIDKTHEDKIIVINSYLSYKVYKKANQCNIKGIVCGGIDYATLTKILGYPLGVAITGMEDVTSIIVTEGFGNISMAQKTYKLLNKYNDNFVSINGATQIRAGVMRPEIFIRSLTKEDDLTPFNEDSLIISINSKIRVIREPYFGEIGTVTDLPTELVKISTETKTRVAEITFENGSKGIVPRANLEVILSD